MNNACGELIGTVAALWRYPVKSMRGESIDAAQLTWNGLDGDRRHAFVRAGDRSRFPWLTGRQLSGLLRYAPYYADPTNLRKSPVHVRLPEGGELPIASPDLHRRLETEFSGPLGLIQIGRGIFDSLPVSVMTTTTPARLEAEPRRFRANIVIDAGPLEESGWLDSMLCFGETGPRLRVNKRIDRCSMITIDPESAERDPAVLRRVVEQAENCVGVYASAESLGRIAVGDPVRLQRA